MHRPLPFRGVRILALGALLSLAACGGSDGGGGGTTTTPTIASVTLEPTTATLTTTGQTVTLSATVRDSEGAVVSSTLTWSSSATGVATVNSSGVVTAVADGTATITARTAGVSASATITVARQVTRVVVSPSAATLDVGGTVALTASVEDASGTAIPGAVPTWTSSVPAVATVSASGVVTALAGGMSTITATVGDASATATITVSSPLASIVLSPSADTLDIGATSVLTAATFDADGAALGGVSLTWTSSDEAVATVDGTGVVTGVSPGNSTITAASGSVAGTAAIRVDAPDVVIVNDTTLTGTIDVDDFTVPEGKTVTLDGDLVLRATGPVVIRGNVTGSCVGAAVSSTDSVVVTGTIHIACAAAPADTTTGAFTIESVGQIRIDSATVRASGDIRIRSVAPDAESAGPRAAPPLASRLFLPEIYIYDSDIRIEPAKARDGTATSPNGIPGRGVFILRSSGQEDALLEVKNATFQAQNGGDGYSVSLTGPGVFARGGNGGPGGDINLRVDSRGGRADMLLVGGELRTGDGGRGGNATAEGTAQGTEIPPLVRVAAGSGGRPGTTTFQPSPFYGGEIQTRVVSGAPGAAGSFTATNADGPDASGADAATPGGSVYVFLPNSADPDQRPGGNVRPGNGGAGSALFPNGATGGLVVLDTEGSLEAGQPIGITGGHGGRGADICPAPVTDALTTLLTVLSDPANSNQYIYDAPEAGLAVGLTILRQLLGVGGAGGMGGSLSIDDPAYRIVVTVVDAFNGGRGGNGSIAGPGGSAGTLEQPGTDENEWTLVPTNAGVAGPAGGSCPSASAGPPITSAVLATRSDGTTSITFRSASPFIEVTGTLAADNTFTAEGTGTMVGVPNIRATFTGTFDPATGALDGQYSMDTEKVISSGHPLVYKIVKN